MNNIGIIILFSLLSVVLLICIYWCFIHSKKSRNVNNQTRWELVKFVNKNSNTLLIITSDHETGVLQILKQDGDKVIIQWGTDRHTSIPVGVQAYGPGAELFQGLMDNTDIHYKMLEAIDYKNLENQTCDI